VTTDYNMSNIHHEGLKQTYLPLGNKGFSGLGQ